MIGWRLAVYQISWVDPANVILLENVVDILLLVNREDVPEWLDATTYGSEDDLATWMIRDPVCDVVDSITSEYPVGVGIAVVLVDLRQSDQSLRAMRFFCERCALI